MRLSQQIRYAVKGLIDGVKSSKNTDYKTYAGYVIGVNVADDENIVVSVTLGAGTKSSELGNVWDANVRVEITLKSTGIIEDALDSEAEIIEPMLAAKTDLDGLVESFVIASYDYAVDKELGIGVMGLNYNVKYD